MSLLRRHYKAAAALTTLLTGIVSYYKLDESSGNALDSHGSNDGTVTGATQGVAGKIGTAYDFDGDNDYITLPQIFLNPTEVSWSMWFKSDVSNTTEQRIFMYNHDGIYIITSINGGTSNLIRLFSFADSGGGWSSSTTSYDVTQWHHIVGTMKENDYLRLYVDGVEITPGISLTTFKDLGVAQRRFIGVSRALTEDANGVIDEVGIWSRALTADEISELYNSGNGLTYPF